jgi:hypothetical protein
MMLEEEDEKGEDKIASQIVLSLLGLISKLN